MQIDAKVNLGSRRLGFDLAEPDGNITFILLHG
jgi:hypothetical protein